MSNKVATRIIDVRGRATTVYRNIEEASKTKDKLARSDVLKSIPKNASITPKEELVVDKRWREREVVTAVGKMAMGNTKSGTLYHGSPVKLSLGENIEPQESQRWKESSKDNVSLTSDSDVADHWARSGLGMVGGKLVNKKENVIYIYEVEPLGELEAHRVGLEERGTKLWIIEARSAKARIIGVREVVIPSA